MASLQKDPSGNFHVTFRFQGTRYKRSLKTKSQKTAQSRRGRLEENISLLEAGRLTIPEKADIPTFLLSDGKLDGSAKPSQSLRLEDLYTTYTTSVPTDALEPTTLKTVALHTRHVKRILGPRKKLGSITGRDLQRYVTTRSTEPGKNGTVSAGTIRKEIGTLGSLWNWARTQEYVVGQFPNTGLVYPKQVEKQPFQTWQQIERRIVADELSAEAAKELWQCLYLSADQITDLLDHINRACEYSFLYPMSVMAAHTGARRSELCRSMRSDFDLDARTVVIHERKRSRQKRTTRIVPISSTLASVMKGWFRRSGCSRFTFPEDHRVMRTRKKQATEGCVTPDEASHHLTTTLEGGEWENVPGWHMFRHSFISNCACRGVDQRFIDEWVGHQTDEQRRRYRHLFPDRQQTMLDSVFE